MLFSLPRKTAKNDLTGRFAGSFGKEPVTIVRKLFLLLSLLMTLTFCALLSGCSSFRTDPEELMRPPVMTQEQTEIYDAAKQIIGDDVIFKYPLAQGTHSAFVFYDIDGDQQEESLVFYQRGSDSNVRMNLLDQKDGVWQSVGDYEGAGTNVEEVSFAHLRSPKQVDLVLEWSNVNVLDMTITVMSYQEGRLIPTFSNAYASSFIGDMDKDGVDELLIFSGNRGTVSPAAMMVKATEEGTLTVSSDCLMCPDVYEYRSIQKSITSDGDICVVVDGSRAQGALSTEIIACVDGHLRNLIYSEHYGQDYTMQTYRVTGTLSTDIDYDGMVEIPLQRQLPNADNSGSVMEPVFLTTWAKLVDSEFQPMMSAVVNENYGYYFIVPAQWEDNVTVVATQSNEWAFCIYREDLGQPTIGGTLFTIRAFSQSEYFDDFDTRSYEKITENEKYAYYVRLEYLPGSDLNLSFEEISENFIPISQ